MDVWIYGYMDIWDGWMDGWMGWMGWMDGWDGWDGMGWDGWMGWDGMDGMGWMERSKKTYIDHLWIQVTGIIIAYTTISITGSITVGVNGARYSEIRS